jgi:hypothetical protein
MIDQDLNLCNPVNLDQNIQRVPVQPLRFVPYPNGQRLAGFPAQPPPVNRFILA